MSVGVDNYYTYSMMWIEVLKEVEQGKGRGEKLYIFATKDKTREKIKLTDEQIKDFSLKHIRNIETFSSIAENKDKIDFVKCIKDIKEYTLKVIDVKENKTYSLLNHYLVAVAIVLSGSLYYWFKEKKELEKLRMAQDLINQCEASIKKIGYQENVEENNLK